MPGGQLTVGAAGKAAGLSAKAVRLYEARGLLPLAQRTAAGYRLYDETDVTVLRFIRRARGLGLSLDEIRRILDIRRAGAAPCGTVNALLDERIAQIDRTITDLAALRESLTATRMAARPEAGATICSVIESEVGGHPAT